MISVLVMVDVDVFCIMKKNRFFGILFSIIFMVGIIVYCPIVSYAVDFNSNNVSFNGCYAVASGRKLVGNGSSELYICMYKVPGTTGFRTLFYSKTVKSGRFIYNDTGGNLYSFSTSTPYADFYYNVISMSVFATVSDTNIIDVSSLVVGASNNYEADSIILGVLSKDGGFNEFYTSADELGFIKPSYFADVASLENDVKSFQELVKWDRYSTTGLDLSDTSNGEFMIEFAMKDKSYYANNAFATPDSAFDYVQKFGAFLASNIFPYGSDERSYLSGKTVRSENYGKMIKLSSYSGGLGNIGALLNPWISYSNAGNVDNVTRGFATELTGLTDSRSFVNQILLKPETHNVCLSWDLYARIIAPDGTKGNWLKINKHSTPVNSINDRIDGGITKEPVVLPNYDPTDSFTDAPDDVPYVPDPDDDLDHPSGSSSVVNDDRGLPSGFFDNSTGDTTIINNNYVYNYDNRSWVQNIYTNEDTANIDEGLGIFRMLPDFFGIYLSLFGAFLPPWASFMVGVLIPLIVAAFIFKTVKTVIPFV